MSADGTNFTFDFHELVVDSFAGGGGASTGIRIALGRCPDVAVNHDGEALAMHAANHPATQHIREDVWAVDPEGAMGHRQVGLLWASPDCKHFSKAKGGKPVSKKIRGLAWVITKWAAKVRPRVICMENVEEFKTYGPLIRRNGEWFPDPARKGEYFDRFIARLRRLGYVVEWRELRACDYGAPTIRKRLFLIARRDGLPIVWPEPTHGDPKSLPVQAGKRLPWRSAAECIDWSIPCPSIFERKKDLVKATLRRIAKGVHRYVVNAADPFLVNLTHQGGDRVEGLDDPLRTITGARRGEKALVVPSLVQAGHGEGKPGAQRWSHGINDIQGPLGTITASGGGQALATATLAPFITEHANASTQRNFAADDPLRTQVAQVKGGHFALVAPSLVQLRQHCDGRDIEEPLRTVSAGGEHHGVVTALLAQHNTMPGGGVHPGHDVRSPLSTIIASGSQQGLVLGNLIKYYSADQDPRLEEPLHTTTTKHRFGLVQTTAQPQPLTDAQATRARQIAALLREHGLWDDREFVTVTIRGQTYVIVDLGMRMLTPRELSTAQGFPLDYIIDRGANGKPLSKTAQVRMIGNSVCPPVAAAIVRANFRHEQHGHERSRRRSDIRSAA